MMNRKFKVECELTAGEMAGLMSALSAAEINAHNYRAGFEGQSRLWGLLCSVSEKVEKAFYDPFWNSLPHSTSSLAVEWRHRYRKIVRCAKGEGDYVFTVAEKEVV